MYYQVRAVATLHVAKYTRWHAYRYRIDEILVQLYGTALLNIIKYTDRSAATVYSTAVRFG
eukprot:SAG31_NODE_2769_length_5117_cov_1.964727_5_plen_61_part_00